jgi:LysM repeat protein
MSLFFITSLSLFSQNVEYSFNGRDGKIFYHTVEQGQTVYGISIMYHVTEEDIYNLNPSSREYIKIGEKLKIPQKETFNPAIVNDLYIFHTIQPGETIYGVSRQYNITQEQLANANLGLTPQTFASGKTIRIPVDLMQAVPVSEKRMVTKEIEYTVKRRETMFSICRTFKVTEDQIKRLNPALKNGLKAGMVIKIPVETEETVVLSPEQREIDINTLLAYRNISTKVDMVRIAVLLPVPNTTPNITQTRIEFYEGIVLAVKDMRDLGVPVELTSLDIGAGTQKLREVLQNEPLDNYNLIIGGETNEQIAIIADFVRGKQIKYVVPFSSGCESITSTNANLFQVYPASQNLYSYATTWACSLFPNYNIIFVNTNDQKGDKTPFVRAFKADLAQRSIAFHSINYEVNTFANDISGYLSTTKPNLIVPQSSSLETLDKIKSPLRSLIETRSATQITLFGYPEWQRYTDDVKNKYLEDFYALNTHIYTSFYANNLSPEIQQFKVKYKYWFNKNMINHYPKYALFGYDLGMFFISAIHSFGTHFENNIRQVNHKSLQNGFRFERVNNWGGFMNTNLFMVNYKRDFTITRAEKR